MVARPNRPNLISCPMTPKSTTRPWEPPICRTKMTCLCSFSRSSSSCRLHSLTCVAITTTTATTRPPQTQLKTGAPSGTQKVQMYHQVPHHKQYSLPWQTSNSNSRAAPLTLVAKKGKILAKAPKTMPTRATTPAKYQTNNRTPTTASMAPPSNSSSNNRWASNNSSNLLAEI